MAGIVTDRCLKWAADRCDGAVMLEMRTSCERCGSPLPLDAVAARICSFECTFCAACTDGELAGACPNCGGELVRRPIRPAAYLEESAP